MVWGFFSAAHIITIVMTVIIACGLYFLLKKKKEKTQILVLGIFSFSGLIAIAYNLIKWNSPFEYLPLHLCSLNAMVLPVAVFTKSKTLNNLLLLWALGAMCAIIINTAQAHYEIFSFTFVIYYFPHVFEFTIPILMFALKIVKKDFKCILSTILITLVTYSIIHFINVALNKHFLLNNILDNLGNIIKVNYMYSITPSNPILRIFYNIIPHSYWYLLLAFPIILVYLVFIYLNEIRNHLKKASLPKAH